MQYENARSHRIRQSCEISIDLARKVWHLITTSRCYFLTASQPDSCHSIHQDWTAALACLDFTQMETCDVTCQQCMQQAGEFAAFPSWACSSMTPQECFDHHLLPDRCSKCRISRFSGKLRGTRLCTNQLDWSTAEVRAFVKPSKDISWDRFWVLPLRSQRKMCRWRLILLWTYELTLNFRETTYLPYHCPKSRDVRDILYRNMDNRITDTYLDIWPVVRIDRWSRGSGAQGKWA